MLKDFDSRTWGMGTASTKWLADAVANSWAGITDLNTTMKIRNLAVATIYPSIKTGLKSLRMADLRKYYHFAISAKF